MKLVNKVSPVMHCWCIMLRYRELRLACDASSYGIGTVISHVMDDGQERPIAYPSQTLSFSERNYAQIECEALSIVFGV